VPVGWRDQRPSPRAADHRGRRRRRDRQGDLRRAPGPAVRRPGHGLRLDWDRAPGLGHGATRVRARGRSGSRRGEEDDLHVTAMAGISFEAEMSRNQAEQLARLMQEGRQTRPAGVLTATLEFRKGRGRLVAIWRDRDALDRYLSEAEVPRGTELMRKVGLEPQVKTFDVLELG